MKKSLKDRLVSYLERVNRPVASGTLQRLVAEKTTYTPRTVVRRLEELAEEGILSVEYREKNHAWYSLKRNPKPKHTFIPVVVDGVRMMKEVIV